MYPILCKELRGNSNNSVFITNPVNNKSVANKSKTIVAFSMVSEDDQKMFNKNENENKVGGIKLGDKSSDDVSGPSKRFPSKKSSVVGSTIAGVMEIALFHPIDTAIKRLQNNQAVLGPDRSSYRAIASNFFSGGMYASIYKVSQRVYKFSGQPIVNHYVSKNYGDKFDSKFGSYSSALTNGVSGSIIGAGEVALLLPLDALKIKMQTNPDALKGMTMSSSIRQWPALYSGWEWTVARNIPGSFALFGINSLIQEKFLQDRVEKGSMSYFISSGIASAGSVAISHPIDVVKTRIQSYDIGVSVSGRKIVMDIIKEEGVRAFASGLGTKLMTVVPKLTTSFALAQSITARVSSVLDR